MKKRLYLGHNVAIWRSFVCALIWFGLVYLFIYSVTHVTLDTLITDYNIYFNFNLFYLPLIHYKVKDHMDIETVKQYKLICKLQLP